MTNPLLFLATTTARLLPAPARRALYHIGPLTRLIRQSLNRAAPAGLTEVTVAAGGLEGMRLALDLQAEKDYWLGTYETNLQAAIQQMVKPGMIAYDVGANIGYVSLLLARVVGETGKVIAFEALPANIERLRANITLNGLEQRQRVQIVHAAVTTQPGPVRFLTHASTGMGKAEGSAGRDDDHEQKITIPGVSLDDFVYEQDNPPPQVVKIDIEGGEVLALPGMRRVLAEARPLIFLELHGERAARVAWETLTGAGYRLCRMKPGCPAITGLDALDWKMYVVGKRMR